MVIGIFYRKELKEYDFGQGHPFRGKRFEIFVNFLKKTLPEDNYKLLEAELANDEDLSLICEREYIEFTKNYFEAVSSGKSYDGKFYLFHSEDNKPIGRPGKLEKAARLIIGQAKMAADLIQEGKFKKLVSIGGGMHHAKPNYGEGFCIYNDVAFAAKYLIEKYKLKRILILDTDAHAGNGTMEYFYEDGRVLFIDIHQDPRTLYPGTGFANQIGKGKGEGFIVNIPLPQFVGDSSYKIVFEEIVEPLAKEFKPQIVIRNGGSDPHFADTLSQLGLTTSGLEMIGKKVREISEICGGKVIDMIASGYNEEILPIAWLALISGLAGWEIRFEEPYAKFKEVPRQIEKTKEIIEEVRKNLKNYWKCFR
jgi:acetoin utilization protein AcuC